ncbi:HAD family hydrolase [Pseudomonas sp. S9]|uniref:HAD family hydrolase n=1 Tax=Pseudomonas sp. S9 TaxID=686578 RepID=UPI0002556C98|nr:HAD-IA family hydrolase [Pseudomonas sp. S9]
MTIKLITFDLDDTLWDVTPVMQDAEAALRNWLTMYAPKLGAVPVEHLWEIRNQLLAQEPALKHRLSELRRRILLNALLGAGYVEKEASALAETGFQVFLDARHQVELFAEVHPTLEALASQFQLGVITNGNADVRRLGLADYFQFALCAEDLGIGKPDPKPFQEALRHANVSAELAVHIGDHPSDEIAGAQAAGMRAIWFNPLNRTWPQQPAPDGEISSLAQLPALLNSWLKPSGN